MKNASLFLLMVFNALTPIVAAEAMSPYPCAPERLRCEYSVNPIGLDVPRPRLSWQISDSRRGAMQSAYRIMAASNLQLLAADQADLWDTGKVLSDQSIHVPYAGPALKSAQRVYWRVRTWDTHDEPSPWSEPAFWEMGLLSAQEWSAKWISSAEKQITAKPVPLGKRFWHPDTSAKRSPMYFRAELQLREDPRPQRIFLWVASRAKYTLFVNGERIGEGGSESPERHLAPWATVRPGRNVLAISVANDGPPTGVRVGVRVDFFGGETLDCEPTWVCSDQAAENWNAVEKFDLKQWRGAQPAAEVNPPSQEELRLQIDGPRRPVLARKEFTLPVPIHKARAYVSGLGAYELHINGQRVGKDLLTPGWTFYPKRVFYQTYDVTDLLQSGPNAVGAVLGNGWWSSGLGWLSAQERYADPNQNLRLLVQLEVECADGSRHRMISDGSWKTQFGPLLQEELYHGETYDARLEMPGWDSSGFDDRSWRSVIELGDSRELLCAQQGPPVRVVEELRAVKLTEPKKGVYVFDFGQNHAGRCRLRVQAPAGTEIRLRRAEMLHSDGQIDNRNYRSARATDLYICKGQGEETWHPAFTDHGYRYAELTGYPGKPAEDTVVSQVIHSNCTPAGKWESSNPLLNRILKNIIWTQRSNIRSVPTDCPRDERLGWDDDGQFFASTGCWNMDMAGFYTKWTQDIIDSQQPDGNTANVSPAIRIEPPTTPGLNDSVLLIPWVVYRFYGDRRILEESYASMKNRVEYKRRHCKDSLYEEETTADWNSIVPSPSGPIGSAYYYHSCRLLSQIADVLGKDADAKEYGNLADEIARAFNAKHLDPKTNQYTAATQTAQILPLAFDIAPQADRQSVADKLARDMIDRDFHLSTGQVGTPLILPTLSQFGYHEAAYRMAAQETFPSLGYMVRKGATTVWEQWDGDRQPPDNNAQNLCPFGAMAAWFYESLAGIELDDRQPGLKHFTIQPQPAGDLTWVTAEYPSMYGRIVSKWRRDARAFHLEVVVPANTTATIHVPADSPDNVEESNTSAEQSEGVKLLAVEARTVIYDVGSGSYHFVVRESGRKAGALEDKQPHDHSP